MEHFLTLFKMGLAVAALDLSVGALEHMLGHVESSAHEVAAIELASKNSFRAFEARVLH